MTTFVNIPPLTQEEKDVIQKDAVALYGPYGNSGDQFDAYEHGRHHERYLASQEKQKLTDEVVSHKEQLEHCYEIMRMLVRHQKTIEDQMKAINKNHY
jgi:hypothetical protein